MPSTIRDLTELTTVAVDDYLLINDTSDLTNRDKRISRANLIGGALTGGGVLATGGFTLTVPATGIAALTNVAQAYSAQVILNGGQSNIPSATNIFGAIINMPAGTTVTAIRGQYNSANAFDFWATATQRALDIYAYDNGNSAGPYIAVRNNNNGSTPAAGSMRIFNLGGTQYYLWPDTAALFRIGSIAPTNSTDTGGTVVGTQTSQLASKTIVGDGVAPAVALRTLVETPVVEFEYQDRRYNGSRFHGIVAEWSPAFVMDAGRVFSPVSAFGYCVQSTKELVRRISELEAKLSEMQGE